VSLDSSFVEIEELPLVGRQPARPGAGFLDRVLVTASADRRGRGEDQRRRGDRAQGRSRYTGLQLTVARRTWVRTMLPESRLVTHMRQTLSMPFSRKKWAARQSTR
jgi:hypothetical protein